MREAGALVEKSRVVVRQFFLGCRIIPRLPAVALAAKHLAVAGHDSLHFHAEYQDDKVAIDIAPEYVYEHVV